MSKAPATLIAYTLLQSTTEHDLEFRKEFIDIAETLIKTIREYYYSALGGGMADAMYELGCLASRNQYTFSNVIGTFYEYIESEGEVE